jgi:hypothetical protein
MSRNQDNFLEATRDWSRFSDAWREVRTQWKDDVAARFEKQFISAWEADIPPFLAALETLEEELQAAERELR